MRFHCSLSLTSMISVLESVLLLQVRLVQHSSSVILSLFIQDFYLPIPSASVIHIHARTQHMCMYVAVEGKTELPENVLQIIRYHTRCIARTCVETDLWYLYMRNPVRACCWHVCSSCHLQFVPTTSISQLSMQNYASLARQHRQYQWLIICAICCKHL